MIVNTFGSSSEVKEAERRKLEDDVRRFLENGGVIVKSELRPDFPVPRPPHKTWHKVVVGYAGRTAYQRVGGAGEIEED